MSFKKGLFKKYAICFSVGGVGYGIIELLWRGRTHWTMIIAGGICFIIFSLIEENLEKKSVILKSLLCSLAVTTVELIFGVIFNVWLGMKIWDYSKMPLNLLGQICPLYSLGWCVLALGVTPLVHILNRLFACNQKV